MEDGAKIWSVASIAFIASIWLILWKQSLNQTLSRVEDTFTSFPGGSNTVSSSIPGPLKVVLRILILDATDVGPDRVFVPFGLGSLIFTPLAVMFGLVIVYIITKVILLVVDMEIMENAFPNAKIEIDPLNLLLTAWAASSWQTIVHILAVCLVTSIVLWFAVSFYLRNKLLDKSFTRSMVLTIYMLQPAAAFAIILTQILDIILV
jgi:hypothetical protein